MAGVRNDRPAVRAKRSNNDCGPRPNVVAYHLGALQALHALDNGVIAVGANLCAHRHELVDVTEAPSEQILGNDAGAIGDAQH